MKTDSLFFRLFKEMPECFFELLDRPSTDAARYRFDAVEIKDTAVRLDGFYALIEPNEREPVYFVEFQNHRSERTYSNLLLKIGLYLEKVNPNQDRRAVVIYPNRSVEQENLHPYRGMLQLEQFTRIYLEDLPEAQPGKLGLSILRLIAAKPTAALVNAQKLIPQVRQSIESGEKQQHLIEFIETVVAYQWPHKSREELEKMLQVESFRETRIFQEALEEGMEKGREEGREEAKIAIARQLLANKRPLGEIVKCTGLTLLKVKKLKKDRRVDK
jgi:predicted transposase/invertase (TIGR01784 family)